jgi:hypothetical protein
MIEAFERHLTAIDIGKKFDNAKTNDDRIAICKEFLEKHGYEVGLKPTKVEFDAGEPYINPFGQKTWVSNGTSSPPITATATQILQASIKIPDMEIQRRGVQAHNDPIYQKQLMYEMIPELAKYMRMTLMPPNPYDSSCTLIAKLGVFKTS